MSEMSVVESPLGWGVSKKAGKQTLEQMTGDMILIHGICVLWQLCMFTFLFGRKWGVIVCLSLSRCVSSEAIMDNDFLWQILSRPKREIKLWAQIVNELWCRKGQMNATHSVPPVNIHQQVHRGLRKLHPEISLLFSGLLGWTEELIHQARLWPGHTGGPHSLLQVPGNLRELQQELLHWKGDANTTPSHSLTRGDETHPN